MRVLLPRSTRSSAHRSSAPRSLGHLLARGLAPALTLLLAVGCASTPGPLERDDTRPADAWLSAIEAQDWAALGALLADDAVYEDPTAADERGAPLRFEGRDAIVAFWRDSSDDSEARDIRYRIDDSFESGGVTVLTLWLTIGVGGAYWDVDTEVLWLSGRQITVVTERDGRIVRVADHVDYDAALATIDALREEHGARAPAE